MTVAMHAICPTRPSTDGPTDIDLLRRCAAGDAGAFRELFDRHQKPITEYLYRLLEDREEAEDAAVDVFLKAWRGAAAFRERAAVRNWLYRIATHGAIDRLRSRKRVPVALTTLTGMDERDPRLVAAASEQPEAVLLRDYQRARDLQALRLALRLIRPEDRTLIALRCFEHCCYEQITEITGLPVQKVRSRLHRARERLKRQFHMLRNSDEALEPLEKAAEAEALDAEVLLAC